MKIIVLKNIGLNYMKLLTLDSFNLQTEWHSPQLCTLWLTQEVACQALVCLTTSGWKFRLRESLCLSTHNVRPGLPWKFDPGDVISPHLFLGKLVLFPNNV